MSDPADWEFEDFTADLIDRYYSWLAKHGKNGKPLPSHQIYVSGLKYFLEKKFQDMQKELPFKSDPSWYSKARRKGNMQINEEFKIMGELPPSKKTMCLL